MKFSINAIALATIMVSSAIPQVATAYERRYSASFCSPVLNWPNIWTTDYGASSSSYGSGTVLNYGSQGTFMDMACPIVSDTTFEHSAITLLHIHGVDADSGTNGYFAAAVCVDYWAYDGVNGIAGTCSSNRYSGSSPLSSSSSATYQGNVAIEFLNSGSPHFQAAPNLDAWTNNAGDFPYVWVALPGRSTSSYYNNGYSNVAGYYTAN